MINFEQLERIDEDHGHNKDCLRVFRQGNDAYKTVVKALDVGHSHERTLRNSYESIKRCDHPNIIKTKGLIETEDYLAIHLPYYSRKLGDQWASLSRQERVDARERIEDAVRYLFEHHMVHGDLVLKNLFYEMNQPILFDFQTAQVIKQDCAFEQSLDVVGHLTHAGCCTPFPSVNLHNLFNWEIPL